jgi:pilus assembly protein CpaB
LRRRTLTIALAGMLALIGAVAVLGYVRQANERAVKGLKAETVMVAADAIPAGTSLAKANQEHLLSTEKVPESSLNTPAVQSVTAANEHLVMSGAVARGQVLLTNMLASPGTSTAGSNGPVLPLPQGAIAVTMEICLDADVAGFVQPGSYVTVFDTASTGGPIQFTCTSHQPPKGPIVAGVVVSSVEVLSVTPATTQGSSSATGQLAADPDNPSSSVASSGEVLVTLAATNQNEADRLVALTTAGDPTFGLLTKGFVPAIDPDFQQFFSG